MQFGCFRFARLSLAMSGLLVACTGNIAPGLPDVGRTGGKDSITQSGGTGGHDSTTNTACLDPASQVPLAGPSPRLTNRQYNNTLKQIFPDLTIPAQTVVVEGSKTALFDNDAAAQTISPVLVENLQKSAQKVGELVAAGMSSALPCKPTGAASEITCGRTFVLWILEKAFRRPPTESERSTAESFFEGARNKYGFADTVALMVEAVLQSPEFIYLVGPDGEPDTLTELTPFQLASRLSYFLWDAPPDDELYGKARDGLLLVEDVLDQQARRLIGDPRARGAIANFQRQWMRLDRIDVLEKDSASFPMFSSDLPAAMRTSIDKFLEFTFWDGSRNVAGLLTDSTTFVNAPLAPLLGISAPAPGTWTAIQADKTKRAGLLTQVGLMATLAHPTVESPILRGVFVLDSLLCAAPPAPPAGVNTDLPTRPEGAPPSTLRERIEQTHIGAGCRNCHIAIDGIGFGLQNYDGIGMFRESENLVDIDAQGTLMGTDVDGPFDGAIELSERLAQSQNVRDCVVRHFYSYALARGERDSDACALEQLGNTFASADGEFESLLLSLVKSPAFRSLRNL